MALTGASFYDTLNKMMIGFLILLPFVSKSIINCSSVYDDHLSTFISYLLIAGSWLTGIFFWTITSFVKNNNVTRFITGKLLNKSYSSIKHAETTHYSKIPDPIQKNLEGFYLKCYYDVQKNGLLGNVPVLESLSEFFFNFMLVLIIWILLICFNSGCGEYILLGCIKVAVCNSGDCDCIVRITPLMAISIGALLIAISFFARIFAERKIQKLIFEAYFYSDIHAKNTTAEERNT